MTTDHRPRFMFIAFAVVIIVLIFNLGDMDFVVSLFLPPWDKLAHFLTYGTLTALLRIGIGGEQPWLLVILIGIIGSLDEWRQISIPGRTPELTDLVADVTGAVVAIKACEWFAKSRKPLHPSN